MFSGFRFFFSSGNKIEIEHICPDTIDKTRYAEYGLENEEEYIKYKCMIGNLTLLEKNINSSISNDSYEKKISAYTGSRFHITKAIGLQDNSGSAEAQKRIQKWITPFSTWTKTDIISRQEMIYKICERIWSIDGIINDF